MPLSVERADSQGEASGEAESVATLRTWFGWAGCLRRWGIYVFFVRSRTTKAADFWPTFQLVAFAARAQTPVKVNVFDGF